MKRWSSILLALSLTAAVSVDAQQTPPVAADSTCLALVSSPKNTVLAKLLCVPERVRVDTVVKTDTVFVQAPRAVVTLTVEAGDTLRIRPTQPFILTFRVQVDSAGLVLSDSARFTVSDTSLAKVFWNKFARRLEIYTTLAHTKGGPLRLTAAYGAESVTHDLFVVAPVVTPPDTTPPDTASPPVGGSDQNTLSILRALFGTTVKTVAETKAIGGLSADSTFMAWENKRWLADSAAGKLWEQMNYYDRCLMYYAYYARTGNQEYKMRGDAICESYLHEYLVPNNFAPAIWWWMPDGLAVRYQMTGDTLYLTALARAAKFMEVYFNILNQPGNVNLDGRNRARLIQSYLLNWKFNAPALGKMPWDKMLDSAITATLNKQDSDGAWRDPNRCNYEAPFMSALITEQLIRSHDTYRADARIPVAVKKWLDFVWSTQLSQPVGGPLSFFYQEGFCTGVGARTPAPDLNGLFVSVFAWYGKFSGDSTYTVKAEAILKGGITGTWFGGSKQFNQFSRWSWLLPSYR